METYQLFKFDSCPYCAMVRRFLDESGVEVELQDILQDRDAHAALVAGGGSQQVPCLRIQRGEGAAAQVQWLYESADIIAYLQRAQAS